MATWIKELILYKLVGKKAEAVACYEMFQIFWEHHRKFGVPPPGKSLPPRKKSPPPLN